MCPNSALMEIISKAEALKTPIGQLKKNGHKIGFVPTMGALHQGHLSLIKAAISYGDKVVVSIFVNPTQFNDLKDLENYPRNLNTDLLLLKKYPVEILFMPEINEMYPEEDKRKFNLNPLDKVMEGKYRPGHFNGVAQIVSKLFDAVNPDRAYFGLKDFQQLAIIRQLCKQLEYDIEIIGCPIIRESDGLAMSSRNMLLNPSERDAAPLINRTLVKATALKGKESPSEIRAWVIREINSHPFMNVEYFEIVDDKDLMPVSSWDEPGDKIGCIAVHLGKVRLIDNRYFT